MIFKFKTISSESDYWQEGSEFKVEKSFYPDNLPIKIEILTVHLTEGPNFYWITCMGEASSQMFEFLLLNMMANSTLKSFCNQQARTCVFFRFHIIK